jgi:hypothetical protein
MFKFNKLLAHELLEADAGVKKAVIFCLWKVDTVFFSP